MPKQPTSYSLRRDETVGPGLMRILKTMAEDARELSGRPESELLDSIHDLRTLIKRLRAYLWFLRPVSGKVLYRHTNIALRKAANRLGQARDVVAVQSALTNAAIPDENEKHLQALVRVSQAFVKKKAARKKTDKDSRRTLKKVADAVAQAVEETTASMEKSTREWLSPKGRVKKALHVAREARKTALREKELPLVHEWRKKSKRLFYLLQLTNRLPDLDVADGLEKADKLQEALGDFQDGVVAENHLYKHAPDIDANDLERTTHLLKKKRKLLLKEARDCWRAMAREL